MSKKNRDNAVRTDADLKADAAYEATPDEPHFGKHDVGENEPFRVEQHDTTPPDGYAITADGSVKTDSVPAARTWDSIIAEYSGLKSRRALLDAHLAGLADELGQLAASKGRTRGVVTIDGAKMKFYKERGASTFQLVTYKAPSEIEGIS